MNDLANTIKTISGGKSAFLGIGNVDREDDGAGVELARRLLEAGVPHVYEGGAIPERVLPSIRDEGFDTVIFLDAVDIGAQPGSLAILDTNDLTTRFPQVSTHKLSLGTLARMLPDSRVFLIGIQPASIGLETGGLSGPVKETVSRVAGTIIESAALQAVLEEQP